MSREQLETTAKRSDATGYHARVQLERLNRGQSLQSDLDYPIVTWAFGDSLAMVFLPGEVVVDYSLRLKRELDRSRLWVCAYANDAPCYIPSERVLKEGGYEAAGAMVYYDRPGPLASGLEQQIVDAIRRPLEKVFAATFAGDKTDGSVPLSPQQSLKTLQTTSNLRVELVVAEPLIADPVAIDFGADGALWVAEMHDYPAGLDGNYQPGGRIRLVQDRDKNGEYDDSTIFLEGIPFPTGVTAWKSGVLICAAPDILYAEDTDGDDKADVVRKLFSGFGTGNFQARVNSLVPGMDGWIYGSCGLFGGQITNFHGRVVDLGDRDFRIKPDSGELEPATGRTQQGRVRDDWGNWFGCDNSHLAYHYPLAEHYLRRNPHMAPPAARVDVVQSEQAQRLLPVRLSSQRFKLSGPPGNVTAACGMGIYRDDRLGDEYIGDLFTCEPVNLLVHRLKLTPKDSSFIASRPEREAETEFLRSTDGWFRPVQAVTGPDGGLWVVDIYRFVIEHPRWIPQEDLARIDVRAGHSMGRIYRVVRADQSVKPSVRQVARVTDAAARLQLQDASARRRIAALEALRDSLTTDEIARSLVDEHPAIRRFAITLAEHHAAKQVLLPEVLKLADDVDAHVRLQVACSLGEWDDPRIGVVLSRAAATSTDPYLVAAALSSLKADNVESVVAATLAAATTAPPSKAFITGLVATACGFGAEEAVATLVTSILNTPRKRLDGWQRQAMIALFDSLDRRGKKIDSIPSASARHALKLWLTAARDEAAMDSVPDGDRVAAIEFLGREHEHRAQDLLRIGKLVSPQNSLEIQSAAIARLSRLGDAVVPDLLTTNWSSLSPGSRAQVIDSLLGREAWVSLLLDRIERREIGVSEIDAARRQRLLTHANASLGDRAAKVLDGGANLDRQKVFAQHAAVLSLKGSIEQGRAAFTKTCSVCHKVRELGSAVGPDLTALANKSPQFLLQEILDPNRNVDSRYTVYVAVLNDGRSITGILASETSASITLLAAESKRATLLRSELDELRGTGKSLMPEGLERDLSPQAMADILAFLNASRPAPKQFEGNSPAVVKPDRGRLNMLATQAEIYGDQIVFEPKFKNIGYWHGANDHVVWSVDTPDEGEFDVWLDYSCDATSSGNSLVVEGFRPVLRRELASTGGWDRYRLLKLGTIQTSSGAQRITLRPAGAIVRGALADVRGLYLVPRGEPVTAPDSRPETTAIKSATSAAEIARQILDDQVPADRRQAFLDLRTDQAAELIVELSRDLGATSNGSAEEYRRIPWIWHVAIASGKRNRTDELAAVLEVSLPKAGDSLRDWQAVVIGGGVINGISLQGGWPRPRLREVLEKREGLTDRWQSALTSAAGMADDSKTRPGTRYDALRMIAVGDWERRGKQLAKYLAKESHAELQMGAVRGLSDVQMPEVNELLIGNLANLTSSNRNLAVEALLRNDARRVSLLKAIEGKRVEATVLSPLQIKLLRESETESTRTLAERILK